ncbi:sulfurtransferase [Bacillus sp. AFS076308]|uniref:sulfurtransferase n=1 Tax=unclassified Bacillus (in: firmicutes) TaxID=185979 RepID=UPI000BF64B33|nr:MULTISPECIES: sulfurtransferase [unclassified Bacillus (in: firmicutes)]PFO02470.1 sulfurtransferase [Bacillus sp. AFS076308]PGV55623.1 sulfurtransferase [Bacillus sp. AFS037270]
MKYVKDSEWLLKHLNDVNVKIVDCRFSLAEPQKGKINYLQSHLPGAVYFDLEQDLSGTVGDHGGRHPLPDVDVLVNKLENAGINHEITVIAYDDGEGAFAARFWWLLKYLGHENVYVLDGGFKNWLKADFPVTAAIPTFKREDFRLGLRSELLATYEEVKAAVAKQDKVLIDSREAKRYLGLEEPIDKKAGHIPGALNKPWMEGLRGGRYLPNSEQMKRFSDLDLNQPIIVYCGSGVTAVPNFLALKQAGFKNVKLYVGSFSDWISYEENKIESSS